MVSRTSARRLHHLYIPTCIQLLAVRLADEPFVLTFDCTGVPNKVAGRLCSNPLRVMFSVS